MTTHPDLLVARAEIDALDAQMVMILAQRQKVVERVITIKQREMLPAFIPNRVDAVIATAERNAIIAGLNPDLARSIWTVMVDWFIRYEDKTLKAS